MTTSFVRSASTHSRRADDRTPDRRLCGGEARDRHAIGRAGHVVQPDVVTERDGGRIAAMFAADADLQRWPRLAAALDADLDELADALAVERDERIDLQNALGDIGAKEARGIVAADAVGGLRQIVGAEG